MTRVNERRRYPPSTVVDALAKVRQTSARIGRLVHLLHGDHNAEARAMLLATVGALDEVEEAVQAVCPPADQVGRMRENRGFRGDQ